MKESGVFVWSSIQSAATRFVSFGLFLILARFLDPEKMGVAQTLNIMFVFAAIFSAQGFHNAIVQKDQIKDAEISFVFYLSIFLGFVSSGGIIFFCISENLIDDYFVNEIIFWLVVLLIPPVTVANGVFVALLRRTASFKKIAIATFYSGLLGGLVGLVVVFSGGGIFGVVAQVFAGGLILGWWVWKESSFLKLSFSGSNVRGLYKYSLPTLGNQLLNFFSIRAMDFFVIKTMGMHNFGVYSVGAKIYQTAVDFLSAAIIVAALSVFSRLANKKDVLIDSYIKNIKIGSRTVFPAMLMLASIAGDLCGIMFGKNWVESSELAGWLCLLGAFQALQMYNFALFDSLGRPKITFLINGVSFSAGILSINFLDNYSIIALVENYVISVAIIMPVSFFIAIKLIKVPYTQLIGALFPGVFVGLMCYLFVEFFGKGVVYADTNELVRVIACIFLYGFVFIPWYNWKKIEAFFQAKKGSH